MSESNNPTNNQAIFFYKRSPVTWALTHISLCCFTLSLFLTTFFTSENEISGFWVLVIGWLGVLVFQFSWLANPLNLLAILLLPQKPKIALLLSFFALTLASQTFYFSEIPSGLTPKIIYIKEFGLGFYLWYFSQICFFLTMLSGVQNSGIKKRGKTSFFYQEFITKN